MNYDQFGIAYTTEVELCDLLYINPDLDISKFLVKDPFTFNNSVDALHLDYKKLVLYLNFAAIQPGLTLEEFDAQQQSIWHMPDEYKQMDIAEWILTQCSTEAELQRCGQELLLYQERDLFPLLCYLKYLVDTMRTHQVVWGVGRGSSVASFVLYKMGVHRINSLYYDLDPEEFLK
jgi:DNA polymerase III alpha subunit